MAQSAGLHRCMAGEACWFIICLACRPHWKLAEALLSKLCWNRGAEAAIYKELVELIVVCSQMFCFCFGLHWLGPNCIAIKRIQDHDVLVPSAGGDWEPSS